MKTAEEYETPEDVVVDIADVFDEHAGAIDGDGEDYRRMVFTFTEVGGVCQQYDLSGDASVQAIIDGFDYYVERQKMEKKSELRETLESLEFLWKTPGGES